MRLSSSRLQKKSAGKKKRGGVPEMARNCRQPRVGERIAGSFPAPRGAGAFSAARSNAAAVALRGRTRRPAGDRNEIDSISSGDARPPPLDSNLEASLRRPPLRRIVCARPRRLAARPDDEAPLLFCERRGRTWATTMLLRGLAPDELRVGVVSLCGSRVRGQSTRAGESPVFHYGSYKRKRT